MHLTLVHKPRDPRIERKQCVSLACGGYDVHLLVGGAAGRRDGVSVHSISADPRRPPLRRQPRRFARLAHRALALDAELYHLHDPHLIPLGMALKRRGARVIYDVHENYPAHARSKLQGKVLRGPAKARMWRSLEDAARRGFDGFVCASEALAERFPPERTVVVGNFPLLQEFGEMPRYEDRPPVALYLGGLRPDRGADTLVELAGALPPDADCLRIAGEIRPPKLQATLKELAARTHRLELLPETRDRAWVREQLGSAAVGLGVQPPVLNADEGWRSNKVFEYMAAGLPVVLPDAPRWREISDRYDCGLAVPSGDPRAIAGAIGRLLRDRKMAAALGRNGRTAVERELNWDRSARTLMGLYERVLGREPSAVAGETVVTVERVGDPESPGLNAAPELDAAADPVAAP